MIFVQTLKNISILEFPSSSFIFTDECNLHCLDSKTGYFFHRGSVDPGTQCNHGNGACVDNICVPMTYKPGIK